MKIDEIRIRRFGVWQDVTLPVNSSGLNVVYGPNEAGKSTLLRFLRGMFYGLDSRYAGSLEGHEGPVCGGSLAVTSNGHPLELTRLTTRKTPRGQLQLNAHGQNATRDDVRGLLGKVNEELFENVFAIGLGELQELATLQGDEVAEFVYGLSLGPQGQRLVEVTRDIEHRRGKFTRHGSRAGLFESLLAERARIDGQLTELGDLRERYDELHAAIAGGAEQIEQLQLRQGELQTQLEGHRFLAQVHQPWLEVHELRRQLRELPSSANFPADGLSRLNRLEQELATAERRQREETETARKLRKQAADFKPDPELEERLDAVRGLVMQRDLLTDLLAEQNRAEQRRNTTREQFSASRRNLPPEWTEDRLAGIDTSVEAATGFMASARHFQQAIRRRNGLQKLHTRHSKSCQQRSTVLTDRLRELGAESTSEAIASRRSLLDQLKQLAALETREAAVVEGLQADRAHLENLDAREAVPAWVYWFLGLLIVGGVASMIVGLVTGINYNIIAGLMWAMLGATCAASAVAWRSHIESDAADTTADLQERIRRGEIELRELREQQEHFRRNGLPREPRQNRPVAGTVATATAPAAVDWIEPLATELAELERLRHREQRIAERRRQVSQLRNRFQTVQRELTAARQAWCEHVTRVGLPEMVRVTPTLRLWKKVGAAAEALRAHSAAESQVAFLQRTIARLTDRIIELQRELSPGQTLRDPLKILDRWETELGQYAGRASRYRELRRQERASRRTIETCQEEIARLRKQRTSLLREAGASTREDFELRATSLSRRTELNELLALAEAEFEAACTAQPNLAIVEEDLVRFNAKANDEATERISLEQEEIEQQLHRQHEALGQLRQERKQLEQDRRQHELQTRRAAIDNQLRGAARDWTALATASRAMEKVRHRFERSCQPQVLAKASDYLTRLTGRRYRNIWAPLGSRELRIDDDGGRTLGAAELSNGTREQLFLAIRLALIDHLREQGIHLPVVLDDVLVNFDQMRTEAAIDTLTAFAAGGQQVLLFTCHLHLAHLCEAREIEPIWLPGHHLPLESRRAG